MNFENKLEKLVEKKKKFSFTSNFFSLIIFSSLTFGLLSYMKKRQKSQQVKEKKLKPLQKDNNNKKLQKLMSDPGYQAVSFFFYFIDFLKKKKRF